MWALPWGEVRGNGWCWCLGEVCLGDVCLQGRGLALACPGLCARC